MQKSDFKIGTFFKTTDNNSVWLVVGNPTEHFITIKPMNQRARDLNGDLTLNYPISMFMDVATEVTSFELLILTDLFNTPLVELEDDGSYQPFDADGNHAWECEDDGIKRDELGEPIVIGGGRERI